jgi:hypothetical protein
MRHHSPKRRAVPALAALVTLAVLPVAVLADTGGTSHPRVAHVRQYPGIRLVSMGDTGNTGGGGNGPTWPTGNTGGCSFHGIC